MHPHPLLAALFSFANGYPQPCPPCLRVANWNECPSEATGNQLPNCRSFSFGVGEQCEGDGECGTSRTENNCNGNQDVYVRCESNIPDPPRPPPGPSPTPRPIRSPPPPFPPFAPLPACSATAVCSAGASCGLCLRLLTKDECPPPIHSTLLPPCDAVAPGDQCEGDGECGTDKTLNNCHGYRDVYVREQCDPGPPPLSPTTIILVGSSVGAVLLLALLVVIFMCCRSRRPRRERGVQLQGAPTIPIGVPLAPTAVTIEPLDKTTKETRAETLVTRDAL